MSQQPRHRYTADLPRGLGALLLYIGPGAEIQLLVERLPRTVEAAQRR